MGGGNADGFPALLEKVLAGRTLPRPEAAALMDQVLEGVLGPERLAAILVALRTRPPNGPELAGFATAMRQRMLRVPAAPGVLLDTCGTGGAPLKTFNISTLAAFVCAAGGVRVAKHGNRSATRPTGSADLLELAGARMDLAPEQAARLLERHGIAFLFAPAHHPALRHAAPVRKALGVATAFNLLGPLCNPAGATHQVLGVPRPELMRPMGEALAALGCQGGFVVHGEPGFDEATTVGPVRLLPVSGGEVGALQILDPAALGLRPASAQAIAAVPREQVLPLARRILSGREDGARRDAVALNAALGFCAVDSARKVANGLHKAQEVIASGAAERLLLDYVKATAQGPEGVP